MRVERVVLAAMVDQRSQAGVAAQQCQQGLEVGWPDQTVKGQIHFLDFVPYQEIPAYINAADVGFIPYTPNFNLDKVLTLKLLEYLAMGKHVVTFPLKTICQVFGESDYVHPAASVSDFVSKLNEGASLPDSVEAAELIQTQFSWDAVTTHQCEYIEEAFRGWKQRNGV